MATVDDFLNTLAEFQNQSVNFPDDRIAFWLGLANLQVSATTWGTLANYGQCLWAAHNLVLENQAYSVASAGQNPGQATGALTDVTVGAVHTAYNPTVTSVRDGGSFNLTTYGQRYVTLLRTFGSVPLQVNADGVYPTNPMGWNPGIN